MRPRHCLTGLGLIALLACSYSPRSRSIADRPPAGLKASAQEFFAQYEAAIKTPRREAIAGFYHREGAIRVLNGTTSRLSRLQLDSVYRTTWTPPAFFAWEELSYDSLNPGTVIVTGGFRWARHGATDTLRFLYAAVVQAVDSGMAIRFEHETLRPPQ
jgi:hypothetical protein